MYGWALNAKAPARSCRGRRRFASSALSDPPGSSARGPIGGSRFAVATPCGGLLGRSRATPSQQLPDTLRGEGLTVGRVMTRGVQLVRHPARSPTCGVPALHVLPHRRRVGDLLPRPHPAADLMLRHRPAGPMQLHPHFLARRRGPNHHPLQQQPHHLALLHHRCRGACHSAGRSWAKASIWARSAELNCTSCACWNRW